MQKPCEASVFHRPCFPRLPGSVAAATATAAAIASLLLLLPAVTPLLRAGQERYAVNTSVCPSGCTSRFRQPIQLLSGFFHMHGTTGTAGELSGNVANGRPCCLIVEASTVIGSHCCIIQQQAHRASTANGWQLHAQPQSYNYQMQHHTVL